MFAKSAKLAVVLGIAALALTACTPPMPPEVKAALLEQTHTCISGNANVAAGAEMTDALGSIQGAMTGACSQMALTPVAPAAGSNADIWIDSVTAPAAACKPETTVPYAMDAAVVAATLANAGGLILSPATVAGILDGSITNWNNANITADNGGTEVANEPITLLPTTDAQAVKAFGAWYHDLTGKNFDSSKLKAKSGFGNSDLGSFAEGSVGLIPFSVFTSYAVNATTPPLAATILVDAKTAEQAVPDMQGIGSAGTQLVSKTSASGVSVSMNFAAKPIAPQGSDKAPTPYGAIYPVNLSLCGVGGAAKATKVAHAVARYMLRQDSQGSLTNYVALPDLLRAVSLDAVSAGLPEPKLPKTSN